MVLEFGIVDLVKRAHLPGFGKPPTDGCRELPIRIAVAEARYGLIAPDPILIEWNIVRQTDDPIGPVIEQRAIGFGHTEEMADDQARKRLEEFDDDVAFALLAQPLDSRSDEFADEGFESLHALGRELLDWIQKSTKN